MKTRIQTWSNLLIPSTLLAAVPAQAANGSFTQNVGHGLLLMLTFAAIGTVALVIGFKVFDKAITKIDLEDEVKKGNVAAAVLSGAVILGIALVIAASIAG